MRRKPLMSRETLIAFMSDHGYWEGATEQYIEDAHRNGTAHPIGDVEVIRYWPEQKRYTVLMAEAEETES